MSSQAAPPPPPGGVFAPTRRPLTIGLVLVVTLVAFEALAVATILPIVSRHLGDLRLYGWVFSAFLLASLVGIVVAGVFADSGSLERPMVSGLVLFAAGLAVGGAAPDMPVLVVGRTLQGLGAGVVPAVAYVAISRAYPEECRPRMFAVLSTAWVVPGLIGPAIAAVVASEVGWRFVFLGLLPLVAVAAVLGAATLRHVPPPLERARRSVPYLPVAGVVAGAGFALAALSFGRGVVMAGGVLAWGCLLASSLRPLTPPGTLRLAAGLPATIASRGLLTACFYAADAYVPYAITIVRHSPTYLAALALTASTLTWTAGSWVQARTVAEKGPRRLICSGEALVLAGTASMLCCLLPSVPPAAAIAAWAVAGAGMGLAYAPLTVTTLDRAAPGGEGQATSALQLCDVLGQALGAGAGGAIVAVATAQLGHRSAVALTFCLGAGIALVALAISRRLPARLLRRATEPSESLLV